MITTIDEFLKLLPRDGWRLTHWRGWGCVRTVDGCKCPVVAACENSGKGRRFNSWYAHAAKALGLDARLAKDIADAADGAHTEIRVKLLQHCGLQETEV